MIRILALFVCCLAACAQTGVNALADAMLAQVNRADWETPYPARVRGCTTHLPVQMDVYATTQWTQHCAVTTGGLIRESYYYVFGEPARTAKLRLDLRPVDESPQITAALSQALRTKLTARHGQPDHASEMMEIGFRRIRFGQPANGDHWRAGAVHVFLHANQSNLAPMGMRRGVQLVILHGRLMRERAADDLIQQVDGLGGAEHHDDPVRLRLEQLVGAPYIRSAKLVWNAEPQRLEAVRQLDRDVMEILRGSEGAAAEPTAMRLLAADSLLAKLSSALIETSPNGEREASEARVIRTRLARYGAKLGGMTHYGGLAYDRDLLWRVWREFPETEAGELAFLELQRRGWNTSSGVGCPANPDLFREVIVKGEEFLAGHLRSRVRKDILFTVAVAYESWWSIARAPSNDGIVSGIPYPQRTANARTAAEARDRAISYYREVARIAPGTAEAASALRRLPRLVLKLDTGQRRFFCSYC